MDQSTTTAPTASISPPKSIVRDVQVMLSAGAIAVAISSLLAIGGIPVKELDKWMFALSVPWFVLLYLVSRKPSFFTQRLMKPISATRAIAVAAARGASKALAMQMSLQVKIILLFCMAIVWFLSCVPTWLRRARSRAISVTTKWSYWLRGSS